MIYRSKLLVGFGKKASSTGRQPMVTFFGNQNDFNLECIAIVRLELCINCVVFT